MDVTRLRPAGLLLLQPDVHRDGRGFLTETYREDVMREVGISLRIVQVNQSRSRRNVIRGLHFQAPPGQAKLITVAHGTILDIAVDIRRGSPTFGQHASVELDDESQRQLYIPPGFAHGFAVLSEVADVVYALDLAFDPRQERGIAWDDPDLAVEWNVERPFLSDRDRRNPQLQDINERDLRWPEGG